MATSVQRSFQSHTETRYHPSGIDTPPYQRAGQENHHKKPALGTSDRETAAIFQPAPTLSLSLSLTTAISIWTSL